MKKEITYQQCALRKKSSHHMAWIPTIFAKIGKFIKIKRDDSTWDDGWEVIGVADGVERNAKDANAASQLYKKTRRASDI